MSIKPRIAARPGSAGTFSALNAVLICLGLYYVASYIFMVSQRLAYPFELEWLEGYFVTAMDRAAAGRSLYPPPNAEFVPFLYPPLFYWITGLAAKIFGSHFWVARIISVISSCLSGFIICRFVYKETSHRAASIAAAGLFFACYGISDFWYDVARVDSLFLALTLCGVYLVRYRTATVSGSVAAAAVLSLAFFTKQSALFIMMMCALSLLRCRLKQFAALSLAGIVFISGGIILMNHESHGWYWFYTFTVPLEHYGYRAIAHDASLSEIYRQYTAVALENYGSLHKLYNFFAVDLLHSIPLALFCLLAWLLRFKRYPDTKSISRYLAFVLAGAVCASISMRCKFGGHINGIIPTVAVAVLYFGVIAGTVLASANRHTFTTSAVYVSVVLQFLLLAYNPLHHIPTAGDYAAGSRLLAAIASIQGEVYLPFHSWYPAMAGKKPFVHKMPIEDIYIGFPQRFPRAIIKKIEGRAFAAIIYDWEIRPDTRNPIEQAIISAYRTGPRIAYPDANSFLPVTGFRVRPGVVYVPNQ